ncbi:unnamed protein product [Schistosoma curassoni]|uniref:CRAL-TRIO domain-containing protein n=1 Tax=Schistosoma curassoni TaxID=6186 RepID=A0A183KTX3_9TREM|nr:unnamed protein product [Schistosoma curassoni]
MQNRRTEDNCVRLHVRAIPKLLRPECRSQITNDTEFSGQYLPSYLEAIGLQPFIHSDFTDNEKQFLKQDPMTKDEYLRVGEGHMKCMEDVKTVTYLDSIIDEHGGSDADVKARIGEARAA